MKNGNDFKNGRKTRDEVAFWDFSKGSPVEYTIPSESVNEQNTMQKILIKILFKANYKNLSHFIINSSSNV